VNENTGNRGNDLFYHLLDNPADLYHSDASNLQLLIDDFPQSGLLRAMLAVKREEVSLQSASAYVDSRLLYKITNASASLRAVSHEQIAYCQKQGEEMSNYFHVPIDADVHYLDKESSEDVAPLEAYADEDNKGENEFLSDASFVQRTEDFPDSELNENSELNEEASEETKEIDVEEATEQQEEPIEPIAEEVAEIDNGEEAGRENNEQVKTADQVVEISQYKSGQEIDDEVFEEIVSIEDISLEQLAVIGKVEVEDDAEQGSIVKDEKEAEAAPASDSYFVFEPALPQDEPQHAPAKIVAQQSPQGHGSQHVSRYNDEKMPYSFMWWLDKTRKEHASIYRPFVADGKFHTATVPPAENPQSAADHLQQQYVENIFAVSSVVGDLSVTPPKVDSLPVERKEDKIIEKFIHEEPQIKHPSKVKLDNENKAKKSSEDRDELVTETLAKIYTEQMLYHKAISTYKKLVLKFPEKSLYFAGQIEQLENKIN
jgi:hypothetical protein